MNINKSIKKLKWHEIKEWVSTLNPTIFDAIETMPVDHLFVYQVEYFYGSSILAEGELLLPDDNGNVYPISQAEVSEEVKKDLGYLENNFIPLSLVLEGEIEIYLQQDSHVVPLSRYSPGGFFGIWGIIEPQLENFIPKLWRVNAGLVNFLSSNINQNKNNKTIKIIYLPRAWFELIKEEKHYNFEKELMTLVAKRSSFWRNVITWEAFFSWIQRYYSLSYEAMSTFKQLIYIASGNMPAWSPYHFYEQCKFSNYYLVPDKLSKENPVVAYSLNYPLALASIDKRKNKIVLQELTSLIQDMRNILQMKEVLPMLGRAIRESITNNQFFICNSKEEFDNYYLNNFKNFSNMSNEFYSGVIFIKKH